jgi:hypothetical protein
MLTFNQHNNNKKRQSFFEKKTFTTGSGPLFLWCHFTSHPILSGNTDPLKDCHLMKKAFKDSILVLANDLTLHEEFNPKTVFQF